MEYTKDMILQVRYGEINRAAKNKKMKWTSRFLEGIQNHKIITAAVVSAVGFISIDVMLIITFIHILSLV